MMLDFSNIVITDESDSDNDGYGDYNYWYFTTLKLGKNKIRIERSSSCDAADIRERHLATLIGQKLNQQLREQLYLENPILFHRIRDEHNYELQMMILEKYHPGEAEKLQKMKQSIRSKIDQYSTQYQALYGQYPARFWG